MAGAVRLTLEAKRRGREALNAAFDAEYEAGEAQARSFENAEIETLAQTLGKAENLERLIGTKTGVVDSHKAFFPHDKARAIFVENAINAYIAAACAELGINQPDLGSQR